MRSTAPLRRPTFEASLVLLIAAPAGWLAGGCQSSGPTRPTATTQVERLARAYPELGSGRFAVVADFEDPRHMELFQLISVSPHARRTLDPRLGRVETGQGCLVFNTGSPNDTLVITNEFATQWYLKRDWRPFDLLLMGVYSPQEGLALQVTIGGGGARERVATHASIPLSQAWNLVRLDLAEIADRIPMDDVREIRLAVSGATAPVALRFDDILLTSHREDLLGDSHNREAGLYVQRVGRRWRIGAASRDADFEITFANGQIVEWYNMAADPYRLRNLVRGTVLGPAIVAVGAPEPGTAVAIHSRIIEMTAVRVVLTCEWRYASEQDGRDTVRRWIYTIYPNGQLYVAVDAPGKTKTWSAPQLGLVVSLAATPTDKLQAEIVTASSDIQPALPLPFLVARHQPADAMLLYVVDDHDGPARITETPSPDGSQADARAQRSFAALIDTRDGAPAPWSCHLLLAKSTKVSDEEALSRALDYARPARPRMELGALAGPADRAGFDAASGCHVLVPEQGRVRFVLDGSKRSLFSPAFQVITKEPSDAWVYVDHLILENVVRDAYGNVVFQIPGIIKKRILVEVLFRKTSSREGA